MAEGMIIHRGGVNDLALAVKAVSGEAALPTNGKEGQIAVEAESVGKVYVQADAPTGDMESGDVFVPLNSHSSNRIWVAQGKQNVQLAMSGVRQYDGETWADVPAWYWKDGCWQPFTFTVYDAGVSYVGTWSGEQNNGSPTQAWKINADSMELSLMSDGNNISASLFSPKTIDFRNFSTLRVYAQTSQSFLAEGDEICKVYAGTDAANASVICTHKADPQRIELDVSELTTGAGYVKFKIDTWRTETSVKTIKITKIELV